MLEQSSTMADHATVNFSDKKVKIPAVFMNLLSVILKIVASFTLVLLPLQLTRFLRVLTRQISIS